MIISLLWIWIARAHIQSLPEVHGDRDSLMTKRKNVGTSCLASSPRFYQWSHLVHTKLWHRNWERGPRLSLLQKSSKIKTGSHVWLRAWVCKADVTLSLWPYNWPAVGAWRSHSSLCLATESCPTLLYPSGYTPPGFYIRGNFQARTLEWDVISSSRGSFWPRDRTCISWVSCIAGRFFTFWAIKEARLEPSLV